MDRACASRQRGARIAGGQLEQIAVGSRGEIARRSGGAGMIRWKQGARPIGVGDIVIEVGIAGDGPAPLRLGRSVERDAGVRAVAMRVPYERVEQAGVEAD